MLGSNSQHTSADGFPTAWCPQLEKIGLDILDFGHDRPLPRVPKRHRLSAALHGLSKQSLSKLHTEAQSVHTHRLGDDDLCAGWRHSNYGVFGSESAEQVGEDLESIDVDRARR